MKKDAEAIRALYNQPFFELVHQAQEVHRAHHDPSEIECCTLLNIKTGRCPEDCAYCPQSAHYETGLQTEKLFDLAAVKEAIQEAKKKGATRFCMGAAWRTPPKEDLPKVLKMIKAVKEEGLESCVTLGMLTQQEADQLADAGLDYYNHNLDTSPEFYQQIITTRTYEDRLKTLEHVHQAGINICCGGILGMGESREDRVQFLVALTQLPTAPKSIPLNQLIPIPGTPLGQASKLESVFKGAAPNERSAADGAQQRSVHKALDEGNTGVTPSIADSADCEYRFLDPIEFLRTVAVTRLLFPTARIRLSAGREKMSEELQAFCFFVGANSIHFGEKLLVTKNVPASQDEALIAKLGATIKSIGSS